MTRAGLIALLLVLAPAAALAWGRDGHRIVCAIAWDEMTPVARGRVEQILDIQAKEQFADLCNWADRYRFQHGETTGWHFVDVPVGATTVDLRRDCSSKDSCVVEQIAEETRALNHVRAKTISQRWGFGTDMRARPSFRTDTRASARGSE